MPTWLAIEDEADICEFIMGMFEVWGITGVAFSDGGEALHWLDKLDNGHDVPLVPELALIDVRLPDASGIDVAARIRSSAVLGNIPVILMTAYRLTTKDTNELLMRSGADMLMYKPLPHMTELRKILNALLEEKSRRWLR